LANLFDVGISQGTFYTGHGASYGPTQAVQRPVSAVFRRLGARPRLYHAGLG
jgi:hypothetical protein